MDLVVAARYQDLRLPVARSRSKRLIDVVVAISMLVCLFPLFLVVAVAIVIDSGWPVLFSQTRMGFEGRRFRIWKFRTMIKNAESMRDDLMVFNEAPYPAFKIRYDPRVTRVGRLLRRSSLDELPQLWNVLVGEMSLVGPRPLFAQEAEALGIKGELRMRGRPGLTCFWQLDSRHLKGTTFEEWLAHDLAYLDSWSLSLDLVLLLRTAKVVVRMTGS